MSKHTPGPWAVNEDGYKVESESEHGWVNDGWVICIPEGPDKKSNAHLIAAAPDMLADIIEAERMFRWYGDLHAAKPDAEKAARNYEMADRLAATIAKAEGRDT